MAKKTQTISQAFDKLYVDLGCDLSSILGSILRNTGNSWKGYGTKWTLHTDSDWFLLEVTPEELDAIQKAADSIAFSIQTHVFPTVYKAQAHEPNSFLLRKEIGVNKPDLLDSMCSFFDRMADDLGKEPYISSEDKDALLRRTRGSHIFTPRPSVHSDHLSIHDTNIVIVDYTAPFESSDWKGSIHIEIDLNSHTITSTGWRKGTIPLSDKEAKSYLDFFSDIKNLNDFFDNRKAFSTPVDKRFVHAKCYDLEIQWNGRRKAISVGYPDIPFKHPFWMPAMPAMKQFSYISKTKKVIDPKVLSVLSLIDAHPYKLPDTDMQSLGDLHDRLSVEFVDDCGTRTRTISMTMDELKSLINSLEEKNKIIDEYNQTLRERELALRMNNNHSEANRVESQMRQRFWIAPIQRIYDQKVKENYAGEDKIDFPQEIYRSGYYTRENDKPKVVVENSTVYGVIPTYIHEMMHAYYDEKSGKTMNDAEFAEEPLAEYGMLRFLESFVNANPEYNYLLDNALWSIRRKQQSLGLAHYGFGEYLYLNHSDIPWEQMLHGAHPLIGDIVPEYEELIRMLYYAYPDESELPKVAQTLYDVLCRATKKETTSIEKTARDSKVYTWLIMDASEIKSLFEQYLSTCALSEVSNDLLEDSTVKDYLHHLEFDILYKHVPHLRPKHLDSVYEMNSSRTVMKTLKALIGDVTFMAKDKADSHGSRLQALKHYYTFISTIELRHVIALEE